MLTRRTTPEDFLRSIDAAKAERRRVKDLDRQDETRLLDPWERYRVLSDHHDRLVDVSEQGDRKTRFALLILGSINAVNLLLATRVDWATVALAQNRLVLAYAACYAMLSIAFFLYAIAALRPRHVTTHPATLPLPLLLAGDNTYATETYQDRWRQASVGEVNQELSGMLLQLAGENALKARALHRVYMGLYVLVAFTAVFLATIGIAGLT